MHLHEVELDEIDSECYIDTSGENTELYVSGVDESFYMLEYSFEEDVGLNEVESLIDILENNSANYNEFDFNSNSDDVAFRIYESENPHSSRVVAEDESGIDLEEII
jgi:hypothetical protein